MPRVRAFGRQIDLKFAALSEATSGDRTVVAAITGKKIKVIALVLVCTAANTVQWKSGATVISGAMAFAANGGYALGSENPDIVLLQAETDEALVLNLLAATQVSGHITYYLEE